MNVNENINNGCFKYNYNPEYDEFMLNKFVNQKDNLNPSKYGYFVDKNLENKDNYLYNHSFAINKIMGNKNESLELELSDLRKLNIMNKKKFQEMQEELKRCYTIITNLKNERNNQQNEIRGKMQDNRFYNNKLETEILKNKSILDEYNNTKTQNEYLKKKLENYDEENKLNIENLMLVITEKNKEFCDIKYKLNEALELKRKLEVDYQTIKFELENLRARYTSEIKEKEVRNKIDIRNFENIIDVKNLEYKDLMNKLILFENEKQLLINDNENLKYKIDTIKHLENKNNIYNIKEEVLVNNNKKIKEDHNDINYRKLRRDFTLRSEALIEIVENQYNKKIKEIFLNKWLEQLSFKNNLLKKEKNNYLNYKNSKINVNNLTNLMIYFREKLVNVLFDLFIKSVDSANNKKTNSIVIFMLKMNEVKKEINKILSFNLKTYFNLFNLIKEINIKSKEGEYIKYLNFINKLEGNGNCLKKSLNLTEKQINDLDLNNFDKNMNKNNLNNWIESSLLTTIKQNLNKSDKNKEFLFLFRLLTILFRIKFPLRGKEIAISEDLESFIYHKIWEAFNEVLKIKNN